MHYIHTAGDGRIAAQNPLSGLCAKALRIFLVAVLVVTLAPITNAGLSRSAQADYVQTWPVTYDANGCSGVTLPEEAWVQPGDQITISDGTGLTCDAGSFVSWKAIWGQHMSGEVEETLLPGQVVTMRDTSLTLIAQYSEATLVKDSSTVGQAPILASDWYSGVSTYKVNSITFTDTAPTSYASTWDAAAEGKIEAYAVENGSLYDVYLVSPSPIMAPEDSSRLLAYFGSLTSFDFNGWFDTSRVTNMSGLFSNCSALTSIDLSSLDTSNVTDMSFMFDFCRSLPSIDLAPLDTSCVTNMSGMFSICLSLRSLDVSPLNMSNVANMSEMFSSCSALTSLDLSSFDTSNATDMSRMFASGSSLTSLDVSSFDTSNATNISGMFSYCSALPSLDISSFDTSNVTDMYGLFNSCSSLTSLDVSSLDTPKVGRMLDMFANCSSLTSLDVSSFDTSSATDMGGMFKNCSSLISLDVFSSDMPKVTNVSSMFSGCSSLTSLDVSFSDTSKVTNISDMFSGCSSLTSLDVSSFDTSGVTYTGNMFSGCSSLLSLDLSSFDTSRVTSMRKMFANCSSLVSLDLSSFTTAQAITQWGNDLEAMFLNTNPACIVGCRDADELGRLSTSPSSSIPAENFRVGKPVVSALALLGSDAVSLAAASAIQPGVAEKASSPVEGDTVGEPEVAIDPAGDTEEPATTDEGGKEQNGTESDNSPAGLVADIVSPTQAHADEVTSSDSAVSVRAAGTTVEKGEIAKGDTVDYTLSAVFSGSAGLKSEVLTVIDVLPRHLSYVEGSAKIIVTDYRSFETQFVAEPTYDSATRTLSFQVTGVPVGMHADVAFQASVDDDATSLGVDLVEYVNQASLSEKGCVRASNTVRHFSGLRTGQPHTVTYAYTGDVPTTIALPSTISYSAGAEIPLAPVVSIPGYTFGGWQVNGAEVGDSAFIMPDTDVTITGNWIKDDPCTLTYAWTGENLPSDLPQIPSVKITKGMTPPLPTYPVVGATVETADAADPFAAFYKDFAFMGWTTSPTSQVSREMAAVRDGESSTIEGDTTITGTWQRRASADPLDPAAPGDSASSESGSDDSSDTSASTPSKTADATGILAGVFALVALAAGSAGVLARRRRKTRG